MGDDLKYPLLSADEGSVLGHANAFTDDGDAVGGHLAVDQEGHVVFVATDPDHDPKKE
jgi:hypothetical protein